MDGLDEFLPKPVRRCKVADILDELDDDTRNLMVRALEHPDAQTQKIARGFGDRGHPVSGPSVRRHRADECGCNE